MSEQWPRYPARPQSDVVNESHVVPGTLPRALYKDVQWRDEYGARGWDREPATIDDAEVVSSWLAGPGGHHLVSRLHAPVLDIDFPAALVPSSTPGHFHLYLDRVVTWRDYRRVLKALARAGLIEKGYAKASIRRRHTAVRVPWLRKGGTR